MANITFFTLRCDHCALWSADKWVRVQAYIDESQRQRKRRKERKSQSSSSFGFDPEDRLIPISEYLTDVIFKEQVDLDA